MKKKVMGILATLFFTLVSIVFVAPIFIVLINSMKSKTFINLETFKLPTEESYVGLENYYSIFSCGYPDLLFHDSMVYNPG